MVFLFHTHLIFIYPTGTTGNTQLVMNVFWYWSFDCAPQTGACRRPQNTRTFWGWGPNPRTVLGLNLKNLNPRTWLLNPRTWKFWLWRCILIPKILNQWHFTHETGYFGHIKYQPQNIFPTPEQKLRICSAVGIKLRHAPDRIDDNSYIGFT